MRGGVYYLMYVFKHWQVSDVRHGLKRKRMAGGEGGGGAEREREVGFCNGRVKLK